MSAHGEPDDEVEQDYDIEDAVAAFIGGVHIHLCVTENVKVCEVCRKGVLFVRKYLEAPEASDRLCGIEARRLKAAQKAGTALGPPSASDFADGVKAMQPGRHHHAECTAYCPNHGPRI